MTTMNRKIGICVSLMLLPWFASGCVSSEADVPKHQEQVTGPVVPSAEEGRKFAINEKLVTSVKETEIVYTRFLEYGPQYLMVRGVDAEGREKLIWLSGSSSTGIRVITETFTESLLAESKIRDLMKDQGEVEEMFLAPNDRVQGKDRNQPLWYVKFEDQQVAYLNPVTGEQLK
ncbi:hypothetical protein EV586_102641 [Tumebacillus sp. BK434]|uniref:hypothetical protein n=1 Tax=Tumebacillus sp. BK434 TaxID=2512169 RepID=UPI001051D3AC|nr:hypothetical protein [Tumebacillus sp. BK434]TCP58188.1 hypothetical protein EV586_102641 [Tumebacillus sp. BK434]